MKFLTQSSELREIYAEVSVEITDWLKRRGEEERKAPFPADSPCYYCMFNCTSDQPKACKYCIHNPEAIIYDNVRMDIAK